jgi:site-specific DNA recombinase
MSTVKVIPQTKNPITKIKIGSTQKRRVAAYARVSTDQEEQASSYEAQVSYYSGYIQERPDWQFVKVYSDEGITGTNTKRRTGFKSMIDDAVNGQIDLILTKSISRFARNTLDSISYVRQLKNAGCEVYFEKENLWTFDSKSEMVFSLLAAIAQEESRSISENVKLGKRWAMKEGKVMIPCKAFLGYKLVNGKIEIDEEEAKVVRRIYEMYLRDGMTSKSIADTLKAEGIPTPSKKGCNWTTNNIQSILTNEKYKGDAILQKVYCADYLEHKIVKNDGVLPKYYVENSHPAIIDREEWMMVQEEMKRRAQFKYSYQNSNPFYAKLICGECGHFYGVKVWHSTDKYRREVLRCNGRYTNYCHSPIVTQELVENKFIYAYNEVMKNKQTIIEDTKEIVAMLTDTTDIDMKILEYNKEMDDLEFLVENLIHDNSKVSQSQKEYEKRYNELVGKYEKVKGKVEKLTAEKVAKLSKLEILQAFIKKIETEKDVIDEFSLDLWNVVLDAAVVNNEEKITFKFKNGKEVTL